MTKDNPYNEIISPREEFKAEIRELGRDMLRQQNMINYELAKIRKGVKRQQQKRQRGAWTLPPIHG